ENLHAQTLLASILRRIFVVALVAGGSIAALLYYLGSSPKSERLLVLQGDIDIRQVNLAFKVDGRIVSQSVDEGELVKPRQVLATLDKRYFEDELRLVRARRDNQKAVLERLEHGSRPQEIAQAKDLVAERQADLQNKRLALARREALVKNDSVTREEYDSARTSVLEAEARLRGAEEALKLAEIGPRLEDLDAARAQLRAEEASLIQSKRRLEDCELVAPSAGVILTRARERGAIVMPGETVFTL